MASKITPDDIKKINMLYLSIGTYSGVARELGISPGTVKKYIVPDFHIVDESTFKHFYIIDMNEEPNPEPFFGVENFGELCVLTDDEKEGMKELWSEMEI